MIITRVIKICVLINRYLHVTQFLLFFFYKFHHDQERQEKLRYISQKQKKLHWFSCINFNWITHLHCNQLPMILMSGWPMYNYRACPVYQQLSNEIHMVLSVGQPHYLPSTLLYQNPIPVINNKHSLYIIVTQMHMCRGCKQTAFNMI